MTADERVGYVAAVLDLADHLPRGCPDAQKAVRTAVAVGVGGQFAHRDRQVGDAVRGQADSAGVASGETPGPRLGLPGRGGREHGQGEQAAAGHILQGLRRQR